MYNTYLDSEPLNTLISNAHKRRPFVLTWNVSSTFLLVEKHKEQEKKTDGRNSNIFFWGLWCVSVQYTNRFFLISLSVRRWERARGESVVPFLVFSRDQLQMWESGATWLQNPRGPARLDVSTTEGCSKGPGSGDQEPTWVPEWVHVNLNDTSSGVEPLGRTQVHRQSLQGGEWKRAMKVVEHVSSFCWFLKFLEKNFLICFHHKGLPPGLPDDKRKVFWFLSLIFTLSPQKLLLPPPLFSSFARPPSSYWNASPWLTASFLPHGMELWPQICLLASWGLHLTPTRLWCGEDIFLTASNRKQGSQWLGTRKTLNCFT